MTKSTQIRRSKFRRVYLPLAITVIGLASVGAWLGYSQSVGNTETRQLFGKLKNAASTSSGFRNEYQKLVDAGEPTSIAEVLGEPIANEKNAAYFLVRAAAYSYGIPVRSKTRGSYGEEDFLKLANAVFDEKTLGDLEALDESELRLLMHAELDQFFECSKHRSVFTHVSQLSLFDLTYPMRILREEAIAAFEKDDFEKVAELALKILKIGRVANFEPCQRRFVVSHICIFTGVKFMYLAMHHAKLTDSLQTKLNRELELLNRSDSMVQMVQWDRAKYIQSRLANNGVPIQWAFPDQTKLVKWFNHHVKIAKKPWYGYWPNHKSGLFEDEYSTCRRTFDSYTEGQQYHSRELSLVRSLIVLAAIEKHESKNGPLDLAKIDQLKLEDSVLLDPFCGDPLKIERQANGWKIYSPGIPPEGELNFIDWSSAGRSSLGKLIGVGPDDPWLKHREEEKAASAASQ